jgi:REP element-mobilizing transposase RayT
VNRSLIGEVIDRAWRSIPAHHAGVHLGDFVAMPDHVHGILILDRAALTLGRIIGCFKAATTREVRGLLSAPSVLWQRGFHDRHIREPEDMLAAKRYIALNPVRWRG